MNSKLDLNRILSSDTISLDRDLIVDKIYRVLERKIVAGEFPPRSRLVERDIAEALGVSRSPIREALILLEKDGLAVKLSNGQRAVSSLSESDVLELYEVWQMVEGFAVRLACSSSTRDDLQRIENILNSMREPDRDVDHYRQLNQDFHQALVRPCPNRRLRDLHSKILRKARWCLNLTIAAPIEPEKMYGKHLVIFDRYVAGEVDSLEREIRLHISGAAARLRQSMHRPRREGDIREYVEA